jgi:hypothetical protein
MGKLELQEIIRKLPRLTLVEKRILLKELGSASVTPPEKSLDDWLLPGIEAELRRRGLSHRALNQKLINRLAPNYFEESKRVREHLLGQLKPLKLKHAELISLGGIFAQALASYRSPVTPIGIKFMLQNVGNIPEAIEQSFPGYLGAGMLQYLIKEIR